MGTRLSVNPPEPRTALADAKVDEPFWCAVAEAMRPVLIAPVLHGEDVHAIHQEVHGTNARGVVEVLGLAGTTD
jgi:hypothetical protein